MVGKGDELEGERGAPRVAVEPPQVAERSVRRNGALEAFEVLLGIATQDLDEQVVHRPEVVMHELGLQPRLGCDPPRSDSRVPLLEQELLRRIDQLGACFRVLRTDSPGCHADHLATVDRGC